MLHAICVILWLESITLVRSTESERPEGPDYESSHFLELTVGGQAKLKILQLRALDSAIGVDLLEYRSDIGL